MSVTRQPQRADDPVAPGQLLADRFRVMRRIAQGGMGVVYEAFDEKLGRPTALNSPRAGSPPPGVGGGSPGERAPELAPGPPPPAPPESLPHGRTLHEPPRGFRPDERVPMAASTVPQPTSDPPQTRDHRQRLPALSHAPLPP